MSDTIEIIAYRSPLEKQFYDNNGPMFVISLVVCMFISFFIVLNILMFFIKNKNNTPEWLIPVSIVLSLVISLFVTVKYVV